MAFLGDYHTHTIYSHGKGTVEDNVIEAVKKGLKEIAITDHGFNHITYNVRRADWRYIQADVGRMRKKYPMINIYLGLETNSVSHKGLLDILPSDTKTLDIVLFGYHKFVMQKSFPTFFKFHLPNLVFDAFGISNKRQETINTDAYIKSIEKYNVDVVVHPNYGFQVNTLELAKACKAYGVFLELNGKRINMSDKQLIEAAETGVTFICSSDAHSPSRVGDMELGLKAIERTGIPFSQVANWDKMPVFRSFKDKKEHGFL